MPPPCGPLFLEGPPTSPAQASGLEALFDVEVFADFEFIVTAVRAAAAGATGATVAGAATAGTVGAAVVGAATAGTVGAAVVGAAAGAATGAALGAATGAAATGAAAAGIALGATGAAAAGICARYDRRRIVVHLLAIVGPLFPVCRGDRAREVAFVRSLRPAVRFV